MSNKLEGIVMTIVLAVLVCAYILMVRLSFDNGNLLGMVVGSLGLISSIAIAFEQMRNE
jgi:hypothetical protein